MIIPANSTDRQVFYQETLRACLTSRRDRFEVYKQLRNYYLFGTNDLSGCPYNKIESTIDTLSAFVYSPSSTKFSIHLGVTAPEGEIAKVPPMSKEITDQWRQSKTHLVFGMGVKWSFVFGKMIFKEMWDAGSKVSRTYLVEPHQFGVYREDVTEIADQEAFVHCYTQTKTQLESALEGNPRKGEIMSAVGEGSQGADGGYSEGLSRLIVSGSVGGVTGSVAIGGAGAGGSVSGGLQNNAGQSYDYAPRVDAELVDMFELYVWNDAAEDYQVVTMASPDVVIYDRTQGSEASERQLGLKGTPMFVDLAPEHILYDYFWGASFLAKLTYLQDWRSERTIQLRQLMEKQVDPAYAMPGWTGITEEKLLGLRRAGAFLASMPGGGKPEKVTPDFPKEAFAEIHEIDSMFDDTAGIAHILQGRGEPGVRSKGQADLMARLGSARPKQRAIVIEEAAEDLATLKLRNIQAHSKMRFTAKGLKDASSNADTTFIAEQFTKDYEVKVDAHSTSPIFIEDRKSDAGQLFEAKAIDRETLLEMFDPPDVQVLKEKLKAIEAKEAEAAKVQMAMEQQKNAPKALKSA